MSEKTPYSQLLQDPRWKKRRDEIITLFGRVCWQCKKTESPMHVHHRYYVAKRLPWNYPDVAHRVLCEECHEWKHDGPQQLEDWEYFLDACFQVAMSHCGSRAQQEVFGLIAAQILKMQLGPQEPSEEQKNDRGWLLEFNPREGHPFHVDRMDWVQEHYIRAAVKGEDHPWRPVAWNLTHKEAQEMADRLRAVWKETGKTNGEEAI